MKVKALAAVLVTLVMMVSAQASTVQLTNTNQLDLSGVVLNGLGVVQNGWALNMSSGNPNGVFVRGVRFQSAGYGYENTVSGMTVVAQPNGDCDWGWMGLGAAAIGGTDGSNLKATLNGFFWDFTGRFDVIAGQQYQLQMMGANPVGNPNPPSAIVIDGVSEAIVSTPGTNWLYTTTFTASSTGKATIAFGAPYAEVGSFVLNSVPEPATMSLLALGGLSALIRRRKA